MELAGEDVLLLSALTGSGGSGTTGGLPADRDQVPVLVLELLSCSSRSQLLSHSLRNRRQPPFH